MSLIHDLGQKLGRTAQNVGKKTGEWVSGVGERTEEMATVGKLNVEIGRIRAEIKQLIGQLGEAAYAAYAEGSDWTIVCGPVCQEIQEKHDRIAGIEAEVIRIREESDRRTQEKREKAEAKRRQKAAAKPQPPQPEPEEAETAEDEDESTPRQAGEEEQE